MHIHIFGKKNFYIFLYISIFHNNLILFLQENQTPSKRTGPNNAHSRPYYVFIEASGQRVFDDMARYKNSWCYKLSPTEFTTAHIKHNYVSTHQFI